MQKWNLRKEKDLFKEKLSYFLFHKMKMFLGRNFNSKIIYLAFRKHVSVTP